MHRRPFLVLPGGECVPLEGDYRVEELRGEWWVLGQHAAIRCAGEREALARFAQLTGTRGPDDLAALALELTDDGPFGPTGGVIGEADLR